MLRGMVSFEARGERIEVMMAYKAGHKLLVGITTTGSVMAYSVPHLQPITRMELYFGSQG